MKMFNAKSVRGRSANQSREGALMIELLVAIALLTAALLPVAYSFASERRYARAAYERAVAVELVDGEMEVLLAGEWRSVRQGTFVYKPPGRSAANLSPGKFQLTRNEQKLKLQWTPGLKDHGGPVVREALIP